VEHEKLALEGGAEPLVLHNYSHAAERGRQQSDRHSNAEANRENGERPKVIDPADILERVLAMQQSAFNVSANMSGPLTAFMCEIMRGHWNHSALFCPSQSGRALESGARPRLCTGECVPSPSRTLAQAAVIGMGSMGTTTPRS
jgi:hypothetical protein